MMAGRGYDHPAEFFNPASPTVCANVAPLPVGVGIPAINSITTLRRDCRWRAGDVPQ